MKKLGILSIIFFLVLSYQDIQAQNRIRNKGGIFGTNPSKKARKTRQKKYLDGNSKAAFKPTLKTLYNEGKINAGMYGNRYDGSTIFGLTGEYYFSPNLFVSANLEYHNKKFYNANRRFFTFGAEGNYHLYTINNTIFLTGFGGTSINRQTLDHIEPSVPIKDYVWMATLGAELMIHVLYNFSVFSDFRNSFSLNEENNHKWTAVVGVKMTIR